MKYKIDWDQHPVYLQLYHQIKEDIVNGTLGYHSKLPSKRLLALETKTSTVTVEHAYNLLCEEGYVESRERSGFFVIFQKGEVFFSEERKKVSPVLPTPPAHAYPEFPFSVLSKTMRNVLTVYGKETLERSPGQGRMELRSAIVGYLARNRGIYVTAEQIVVGSGAEYLYGLMIELLGRHRIYGIEVPSYEKIEQVYRASGVCLEFLALSCDGIDSAALAGAEANVLHTTPYRSFPSGITASASKRHEYVHWAEQGDRYLIEDDFESEFSVLTKPQDTLFSLSPLDHVVYLNTFSRTISPSLRVGYMVLPPKLAHVFREKLGFYSCSVPTYEQLVLASLLDNGDFERHLNRVRRKLRKEMGILK